MKNGRILKNIAMNWNRPKIIKKKASFMCSECFFLLINLFRAIICQTLNIGGSLEKRPVRVVLCCVVLLRVYRSVTADILRIQKELPEVVLFSSLPNDGVQHASGQAY